jgi:hypothetical protein
LLAVKKVECCFTVQIFWEGYKKLSLLTFLSTYVT